MAKELGWKSVYAFDQETLGANGKMRVGSEFLNP